MEKTLTVGFITVLSGRWPRELPQKRLEEYGAWIRQNAAPARVVTYAQLAGTIPACYEAAEYFRRECVDVVVMLYGAFCGDDACTILHEELGVPLILWAPYELPFEPKDRLYANALCAMTMNAASLHRVGAEYHGVYGGLEDARATGKLLGLLSAYAARGQLRGTVLGLFGYRPTAFYNSAFDEGLIRRIFGVRIEETDLKVVFDRMQALPQERVLAEMNHVEETYTFENMPDGHLENHARLYLALAELMREQGYDYASIKCWPEMGSLHTTPCAVLGRLADEGLHIGCEGDVDAALALAIQNAMTGEPCFITDMIHLDDAANTLTYWHCGNAAPSLYNPAYPVTMSNHPLAGQGTAFYGALKTGKVTVARMCNLGGVYKLFLLRGEAVDTRRATRGTMINVKIASPVREVAEKIVEQGIPHHYSLVWEDIADRMIALCGLLNIEVIEL